MTCLIEVSSLLPSRPIATKRETRERKVGENDDQKRKSVRTRRRSPRAHLISLILPSKPLSSYTHFSAKADYLKSTLTSAKRQSKTNPSKNLHKSNMSDRREAQKKPLILLQNAEDYPT